MLIFRYLVKEVTMTLLSLTTILLLVFMSNQFVRYLNRAASGHIPGMIIMKLMMLEMPSLLGLLLPLGFYVALLVAYGRLYADNEMTVLNACGYSEVSLLKHSLIMATVISLVVVIIMTWMSPIIAKERAKLMRSTGIQTMIKLIVPGRFRAISHGKQILYVESMNREHTEAQNVFLARLDLKGPTPQWDILWAEKAFAETDKETEEEYLVLQKGREYEGEAGKADYQVVQFDEYKARLPHAKIDKLDEDLRTLPIKDLLPFNNPDKSKAAELQWRLSVPIMVFMLTLVAVPLSRINPRSGKYAKLLPAIVLYIVYANFMFVSRDWVSSGKIPLWLGMWWLHLVVGLLGCFLLYRNQVKQA